MIEHNGVLWHIRFFRILGLVFAEQTQQIASFDPIVKAHRIIKIELDYLGERCQPDYVDQRSEVALEPLGQIVVSVTIILATNVIIARNEDLFYTLFYEMILNKRIDMSD